MNDRHCRTVVWRWLGAEALRRLPMCVAAICDRRIAITLALVWAVTSSAFSQESILYPLAQQSCGAWSEERRGDDQNLQIWVLGFLSGASVYGGVALGELDADAPLRWIDNYCQWHPIDLVTQALAAFIDERRR